MSTFQKPSHAALLDYESTRSLQDGASYSSYGQGPYVTAASIVPSPMADQASQISDYVPYVGNNEYASSYEETRSPMMSGEPQQQQQQQQQQQSKLEVTSYSPPRGPEGTRVFVQIQSPYDLHTSTYSTLSLMFGTKKCPCVPHFLGFHNSLFQYNLSADTPPFNSTGSPSLAVPLQVMLDGQSDAHPPDIPVGVYTYEQVAHGSPCQESRKRRISCYSEESVPRPAKRSIAQPVPTKEESPSYSASFSPYLQSLPTGNGFVAPYANTSSPRVGHAQYSAVSSAAASSIRAPSPLTPSWSPSYIPVSSDPRTPGYAIGHGYRGHKPSSPARLQNPTLIRTSTLQHSSSMPPQAQSFNPYAMYPSKAVLKLNGDLDTMTQNWTKDEREVKRRLVQFTRIQSGSTIHTDFKPVTPEERAPNSICISCIYWDGKDDCFVTSVDTIYLLESLVGVRFTVEEKNRIRRNLEGFRPLTVSKAKLDSEEFFKVIMGFPAPKPRNIEKDVKVFPWKILSHALKKIIGKYPQQSASYSSTAGALPTPMNSYAPTGAGSDSGTDPHNAGSPQSVPDTVASSTYGPSIAAPAYSPATDHAAAPDMRVVLPSVSQTYQHIGAPYSYPAVCQQPSHLGMTAPAGRPWEMNTHHLMSAASTAAPSSGACYNYLAPMPYSSLPDLSHGSS